MFIVVLHFRVCFLLWPCALVLLCWYCLLQRGFDRGRPCKALRNCPDDRQAYAPGHWTLRLNSSFLLYILTTSYFFPLRVTFIFSTQHSTLHRCVSLIWLEASVQTSFRIPRHWWKTFYRFKMIKKHTSRRRTSLAKQLWGLGSVAGRCPLVHSLPHPSSLFNFLFWLLLSILTFTFYFDFYFLFWLLLSLVHSLPHPSSLFNFLFQHRSQWPRQHHHTFRISCLKNFEL